ncbi:MAG: segregation/condensation protein A [Candidatus Niyogibacteria bacterium]|nr:segregation/condensation protein A [Candidatus Niyogibacteria bacterium]
MTVYHIQTEKFSGPLDMLLSMIEDRTLSINEVSLSRITGDYIAHVRTLEDLPEREVSQFLVIAATLMLIKSRSLLPGLRLDEEEEADIEELQDRLRQLKEFRRLSKNITDFASRRERMYARTTLYGFERGFYPPEGFGYADILTAAEAIIARLPKEASLPEKIIERVITLEEKIEELRVRIQESVTIGFGALSAKKDKIEVIVNFLALLELLKEGIIFAEQKGLFSDIAMRHVHNK